MVWPTLGSRTAKEQNRTGRGKRAVCGGKIQETGGLACGFQPGKKQRGSD